MTDILITYCAEPMADRVVLEPGSNAGVDWMDGHYESRSMVLPRAYLADVKSALAAAGLTWGLA